VKPLVHRTLVHCNQRPRSAPNRAIGRQYFAAAYGPLGWTGMSDEAAPLVSEITPVNVERARFRGSGSVPRHPRLGPVYGRRHRLAMRAHRTGGAAGRAPGQRVGATSPRTDLKEAADPKLGRPWAGIVARPVHGPGTWTGRRYVTSRWPCSCLSRENAQAMGLLYSHMARGTAVKKCASSC
jgi:hypothetical protein